jgi:hypothetical protein
VPEPVGHPEDVGERACALPGRVVDPPAAQLERQHDVLELFRISFSGFGPTELRILLSIGAIVAIWRPLVRPFGLGEWLLFDVGGAIGTAGMLTVFLISAARNARTLYLAEPLKGGAR